MLLSASLDGALLAAKDFRRVLRTACPCSEAEDGWGLHVAGPKDWPGLGMVLFCRHLQLACVASDTKCMYEGRGIYLGYFCFSSLLAFWPLGFLAFRLLGFLASWLLGFLAFRLLGFLAFRLLVGLCGFWWLFGFGFWLASSAFPVPLRQVAFWLLRHFVGLCGFWRLWLFASLLSQFLSGRFGFTPFHWILDLAPRIISITSVLPI